MVVKRHEVYLVNLDPTIGSEIRKTRPCLIISPDEMNRFIKIVIVGTDDNQRNSLSHKSIVQISGQAWANCAGPDSHNRQGTPREKAGQSRQADSSGSPFSVG